MLSKRLPRPNAPLHSRRFVLLTPTATFGGKSRASLPVRVSQLQTQQAPRPGPWLPFAMDRFVVHARGARMAKVHVRVMSEGAGMDVRLLDDAGGQAAVDFVA